MPLTQILGIAPIATQGIAMRVFVEKWKDFYTIYAVHLTVVLIWRVYFIAKFTTNYNVLVKHAMYIKIVMFAIRQFAFTSVPIRQI